MGQDILAIIYPGRLVKGTRQKAGVARKLLFLQMACFLALLSCYFHKKKEIARNLLSYKKQNAEILRAFSYATILKVEYLFRDSYFWVKISWTIA